MLKGKSYNSGGKLPEFEKIIENLRKKVEKQNEMVKELNKEIKPLKDRMDMLMIELRRINSLLSPTFSISEIKKPENFDVNKKQLDDHLRGRVRFIIDGEPVSIQVYVGEIKKIQDENPKIKKDTDDWRDLIQRISLEKSYRKLIEIKPHIFDEFLV
jgi:predicted nuclease with TOPRIM domain